MTQFESCVAMEHLTPVPYVVVNRTCYNTEDLVKMLSASLAPMWGQNDKIRGHMHYDIDYYTPSTYQSHGHTPSSSPTLPMVKMERNKPIEYDADIDGSVAEIRIIRPKHLEKCTEVTPVEMLLVADGIAPDSLVRAVFMRMFSIARLQNMSNFWFDRRCEEMKLTTSSFHLRVGREPTKADIEAQEHQLKVLRNYETRFGLLRTKIRDYMSICSSIAAHEAKVAHLRLTLLSYETSGPAFDVLHAKVDELNELIRQLFQKPEIEIESTNKVVRQPNYGILIK